MPYVSKEQKRACRRRYWIRHRDRLLVKRRAEYPTKGYLLKQAWLSKNREAIKLTRVYGITIREAILAPVFCEVTGGRIIRHVGMIARYRINRVQWVVAQTQPNRERWAAENIARQGREFYLPKIEIMKGATRLIRPLFSRYLFVRIVNDQWGFLKGTFGVTGVVLSTGGMPGIIADKYIDELRSREDADGVVRLPTLDDGFHMGQRVRVRTGLLEGHKGIYEGMDPKGREKVLMSLLGQKTVVLFGYDDLEVD